jgi:hypothetical protein
MAQDQEEKIFADGFVFKRNEKAPDFVIGRMSIKADEAIAFIKQHEENGWVNLGVKQARSGNYYVELDTFKPKGDDSAVDKYNASKQQQPTPSAEPQAGGEDDEEDDLPF